MSFLYSFVLISELFRFMGGPTEQREEVGTLLWIYTNPRLNSVNPGVVLYQT